MNNIYNRKVPMEFKMKNRNNQKQQWYENNSAQNNEISNEEPANLEPIVKNIYKPSANNGKHKPAEVSKWISANQITLNGENVPTPIFTFDESTFPEVMKKLLCKNYEKPTPIQSISWPVALSGFDLISIAKTGSGKTLGFILPAIVHVVSQKSRNSRDGPTVVVLLPTRELAQQVEQVAQEYCKAMRIGLVCVYGGAPKGPQVGNLKRGADIVIATPGRLLDFMDTFLSMARCSFLVMDEADRMLDMGFEPQIRRIAGQIRKDRQTLMFSATWPPEVRKLARDFQQNPVNLTVGSLELAANHNIEQNVEVMNEYRKPERLNELLSHIMQQAEKKTIIFVATKKKADDLHRNVRQQGYSALCIHGDKDQSERNWVLNQFKQGKVFFLFATDVAARGIDVSDIKFVINYDFPNNSEDYVHRIGRTGRRDQQGTAFTFFTDNDNGKASSLVKVLEEAKQNVPEALAAAASMNYGRSGGNWSNRKRNWYGNGGGGNGYGGQSKRTKFDDNDWPKKSASKQFGNNSWKEQGGTQNGNWKGKFDDNEWPKKSASKQFGNNSWNKEQGGEQNGNWKGKNGWQSNGQGQAQSRW